MYSRLHAWSRYLYLAGIVLALVLVIPTAWFPFQLAKVAVFAVLLLVAAVCYVAGGGMREFLKSHGLWLTLAALLLPLVYVVSALVSKDGSVAWTGYAIEWNTVIFAALAALAFILSSLFFRTQRTARQLYTWLFWAIVAATLFQCVAILFGPSIPGGTFADRSVNLVGKWNDLGLLASLLGLFVLVELELRRPTNLMRVGSIVLGVLTFALLAFVNFSLAWMLLLAGAVVVGLFAFLAGRGDHAAHEGEHHVHQVPQTWMSRIPWYAVGSIVLGIVFLVWGPFFNTSLTSVFPVSSLEVRPSYQTTTQALTAVRQGSFTRAIIGMGPNTFGEIWLAQKPAEVNQSAFWSLDFNVGYSTLATALGTVGFLGALAWVLPFILVLAAVMRLMRMSVLNREDRAIGLALAFGSLMLLCAMVFYVPSQNLILLALILAGGAFGFLWRQGRAAHAQEELPSRVLQAGALILGAVLIVASLWIATKTSQRALAEAYVGQAAVALGAGNVDSAVALSNKAAGIDATGDALRSQIQAGGSKLAQLAQATTGDQKQLQQQFQDALQGTITAGQKATQLNTADYRPFFLMAQVYDLLSSLKVQGAYEQASSTYLAALVRNPNNPAITLALAKLAAQNGDAQGTAQYLRAALTQKPNYTDAILFLVQLDVAQNDLNSAVQAAQAAVQSAPGVAPIWFELGLLYYAGNDTKDAIPPLEQALKIQADYANAQYFLGLSYYAQNRQVEAEQLFQTLAKGNPDNQEVQKIIVNMQSGKPALTGIASSTPTGAPKTPATAPIQQ
jgi:tetratricopeptide (TPR) repeat protein